MCYQITLYPMVHFSHNTETIVCYGILKMSHVTRKHHKGKMTRGGEESRKTIQMVAHGVGVGGGTANGPGVPEDPPQESESLLDSKGNHLTEETMYNAQVIILQPSGKEQSQQVMESLMSSVVLEGTL